MSERTSPGAYAPEAHASTMAIEPSGALAAHCQSIQQPDDFRRLAAGSAHLVFQGGHWLATWAASMRCRGVETLHWLTIREASGEPLMGIPLVLRREGGLHVLEMPDCGVSDYLGPIFHRRPRSGAALTFRDIWPAIRAVLPAADLLRLEGLKENISGHDNPFFHHRLAQPNRQCGWKMDLPEQWDDYMATLTPRMRENLAKARRRFLRQPGARMAIAANGPEALQWLEHLDRMQRERLAVRGSDLTITSAEFSTFYKALAEGGIETGEVIMAGLFAGEEVVALNYAVRTGNRATYLRLANAFGPWAPMSPGFMVTEYLIQHLHGDGVRIFDFGLGEYDYKKRFGGKPFELRDLDLPLSWRGVPAAFGAYARRALRKQEWLRRLMGRTTLTKTPDKKSD